MNPARFSVKRPIATAMFIMIVLVLGMVSLSQLKIDLFPDMTFPLISVVTPYPGAGPKEVENYVTRKMEEAVSTAKNLKHVTSYSKENLSIVMVEFNWGVNMDYAAQEVREKIDPVIEYLPEGTKRPYLVKYDPNTSMPFMALAVTGPQSPQELRYIADNQIKKQLEKINGVGTVSISGGEIREIQVLVDTQKLINLHIPINQIVSTLQAENINLTGGRLDEGNTEYFIRTPAEFKTVQEIGQISVANLGGRSVLLREVAQIKDTVREKRDIARYNGQDAVAMSIYKQSVANTVETADRIKKDLKNIEAQLPKGIKLNIAWDQSRFIRNSVDNTEAVAVEGGILAIIIIFFFLASARATFIIGLSIPTSIIATFVLMYYRGMSLNMITLAGMTMGIGRIVDDSIVVLEAIHRHIKNGEPPMQAAITATQEVGLPVAASTFTTIAVFFPIMFVGGFAQQFFAPLATTISFALLASLVVAMTLIPMTSSRLLRAEKPLEEQSKWDRALSRWEEKFTVVENLYSRMLHWAMGHRKMVVFIAFACFIGGLVLMGMMSSGFMPSQDRGELYVDLVAPVGTALKVTDETMRTLSDLIKSDVPEVKQYLEIASGLESSEDASSGDVNNSAGAREGIILVNLVPSTQRKRSQFQIQEDLRKKLSHILPADINLKFFDFSSMMTGGQSEISLKITGDDLDTLSRLGEKVKEKFGQIDGLTQLDLSWSSGNPEYHIVINRERAGSLGISALNIASTIRALVKGERTTKFREKGEEYDIFVRAERQDRDWVDKIKDMEIASPTGKMIPLKEVARVELTQGPSEINRTDRQRCIFVNAGKRSDASLSTMVTEMNKKLKTVIFPPGYTYSHEGSEKNRSESFSALGLAMLAGIILIYLILAAQFESLAQPLIIMLAIPLEIIGSVLALLLTGQIFSVTAFLGILMLTGIVVSNSILLVSLINDLRAEGMPRNNAIFMAGPVRLRPILMTSLATVFAMIPMALGLREGSESFQPLAITVIGGLLTSTFLTLLVIPVAYSLIDDLEKRFGLRKKDEIKV